MSGAQTKEQTKDANTFTYNQLTNSWPTYFNERRNRESGVFWSAIFLINCRDHVICFIKFFRSKCIIFICNVNVALYFAAIMKKVMVTTLIRQLYYIQLSLFCKRLRELKNIIWLTFRCWYSLFICRNSKKVAPLTSHELSKSIDTFSYHCHGLINYNFHLRCRLTFI